MNEYRILFGFGGRAKILTVDSEEQLEIKVLFHIGSKYLFLNSEGEFYQDYDNYLAKNFRLYNNPFIDDDNCDCVSIVEDGEIYGPFYIVKRKADGSLDSLSLSEIRSLTKNMILEDSPFVKFCRVSPRGHAARHEQAKFLSSLLNNIAVKETVNFCVNKNPESRAEVVKEFIIEKVRLLLDEMVK